VYIHTDAGIPSPAAAHFLMHCCRVSIPFCSMPFAMFAPRVIRPVGASVTAVRNKKHLKNVGPIRYCEPPLHCQSPGVTSRTPAIAIAQAACDVHDINNNNNNKNDNA